MLIVEAAWKPRADGVQVKLMVVTRGEQRLRGWRGVSRRGGGAFMHEWNLGILSLREKGDYANSRRYIHPFTGQLICINAYIFSAVYT